MFMHILKTAGFLALLSACLIPEFGCSRGPKVPDVSHINPDVRVRRFDRAFFQLDTANMEESLSKLTDEMPYADFFVDFILSYRALHPSDSITKGEVAKGFIIQPEVRALYDTVQLHFGDLEEFEKDLGSAFQFLKYYFPEFKPPVIYTMVSEYHTALLLPPEEDAVAVSLDLFLGPEYEFYQYQPLSLPRYITRTLTKSQLAARVTEAIVDDLVGESRGGRMLDIMVTEGKKLYILDLLLPYTPDSIKWGCTAEQSQWVEENEYQMWVYFLEEDLLYEDDLNRFRKLVDYSPTSPGMPPESPGRTANWVGLQIVKAYMERYPETTLRQLLSMNDAQELLTKSGYKPR